MNGLKYFLLQLKDCMMETLYWLWEGSMSIGKPITAVVLWIKKLAFSSGMISTSWPQNDAAAMESCWSSLSALYTRTGGQDLAEKYLLLIE